MAKQSIEIRSMDWGQAPPPIQCQRSLSIIVCPTAERASELEQAMGMHYPQILMRVVLNSDRAHRQYSTDEWTSVVTRCSQILDSTQYSLDPSLNTKVFPTLNSHHLVIHAVSMDAVPRHVLACADLIFWYNGDGIDDSLSTWCTEQINQYMRTCTNVLLSEGSTAQWRKALMDANPSLDGCQHWLGVDIRCKHRTWITIPLTKRVPSVPPSSSLLTTQTVSS